jgi:hypothetical protein
VVAAVTAPVIALPAGLLVPGLAGLLIPGTTGLHIGGLPGRRVDAHSRRGLITAVPLLPLQRALDLVEIPVQVLLIVLLGECRAGRGERRRHEGANDCFGFHGLFLLFVPNFRSFRLAGRGEVSLR